MWWRRSQGAGILLDCCPWAIICAVLQTTGEGVGEDPSCDKLAGGNGGGGGVFLGDDNVNLCCVAASAYP